MVDYEQVRADASINALNGLLSSSILVFIFEFIFKKQLVNVAVQYADKLVEQLKKEKENNIS